MAHFLIEVPHAEDKVACLRAIEIFVTTGSHFLANAEWGCEDGEHKAWLIVDVDSREHAQKIIPPFYRDRAKITKLFKVTKADVDAYKREQKYSDKESLHN